MRENKITALVLQHQDGNAYPKIYSISARILYHLRTATASKTPVFAGCYFYTLFYIFL